VALTQWLIDKSAIVRLGSSQEATQWAARIERGLVRIANVTRLEIGYSVRSGSDLRTALRSAPLSSMPVEYQTPAVEDRSMEVLALLADRGQHRAPSIPDLIVAATAELAGLTVLHLDKDFEIIADLTRQPLERLASR
jgi:predicted nucleic acid-binding protein